MPLYNIRYGVDAIRLDIPDEVEFYLPPILRESAPAGKTLLENALSAAELKLENYLEGGDSLLIVVPDRTRRCGLNEILPHILEAVYSAGIKRENIGFLIANGTHIQLGRDAYREILGEEIVDEFPIIEHDCDRNNIAVGTTSRGTPIEVNRLILDTDRILAVGGMLPHYFAGYGGGPKLILPGCSSGRCTEKNHSLSISSRGDCHPGCSSGKIEGNPVIQDIMEGLTLLPPIYHIGIILGEGEKPHRIISGEVNHTYLRMTETADDLFGISGSGPADLVIAGTGGHPKDIDLLQSHKSLLHASAALKKGGTILFFAECPEGIGSKNLEKLLALGRLEEIRKYLLQNYIVNGLAAISLMQMGRNFRVKMMTGLDDETLEKLGYDRLNSANEVMYLINRHIEKGMKSIFFPSASFTIYLEGSC